MAGSPWARLGPPETASHGGMQIEAVEVRTTELALVAQLVTSVGPETSRPVVLVRVLSDMGEGWGECVALTEPTYSEEHAAGAVAVLLDQLVPRLFQGSAPVDDPLDNPPSAEGSDEAHVGLRAVVAASSAMEAIRGHRMAKAAIEMALLDIVLSHERTSLAAFLGGTRERIPGGATIGIMASPAQAVEAARRAVAQGYTRLKCKVAPGRDVEPVRAVRQAFPELALSVDANGSYHLDREVDRKALGTLDELCLLAIEQPLGPDDLVGHARLAAELDTVLVLDESIRSLGQLETAAALGACDGVAVKPGPLGGLLVARAVHDRCQVLGLSCAIGGMLETGIGRAASIALGSLPGFDLPGDLGASDRYFAHDLTPPHVLVSGELPVPDGPGLGSGADSSYLQACTDLAGTCWPPGR